MIDLTQAYDSVAQAEAAIVAAGYFRNKGRCIWMAPFPLMKTAKVVRDEKSGKFFIQGG